MTCPESSLRPKTKIGDGEIMCKWEIGSGGRAQGQVASGMGQALARLTQLQVASGKGRAVGHGRGGQDAGGPRGTWLGFL